MKTDREAAAGVFDSGVEGLTVAREIITQPSFKRKLYILEIRRECLMEVNRKRLSSDIPAGIVRFLQEQQVKAISNTASAFALDAVKMSLIFRSLV